MKQQKPKNKKGQISTEVLYAVGTMVLIFLLLTGITFNRKLDLKKTDDYLKKRTECLKISNTISSISAAGEGTERIISITYNVTIFKTSRISVSETEIKPKTIEAVCSYTGNLAKDVNIAGIGNYIFNNTKGAVEVGKVS
tara:strand:- start:56558 stop:56977 length:420 start_codon:yes stop_codon:yes gene_type:complete